MLDDILRERFVPEPPTNLAYRIIESAKARGRGEPLAPAGLWLGFAEMFAIPRPAFAMATILFAGLAVGLYYAPADSFSASLARESFSSFITADVSVEYGDFL